MIPHPHDHTEPCPGGCSDIIEIERSMETRLKSLESKLDEVLVAVKSAVPNGDLDGHRRAHEQWLEERKEKKEFRQKVLIELAKGTAWAGIVAVATAFWYWVKTQVKS